MLEVGSFITFSERKPSQFQKSHHVNPILNVHSVVQKSTMETTEQCVKS